MSTVDVRGCHPYSAVITGVQGIKMNDNFDQPCLENKYTTYFDTLCSICGLPFLSQSVRNLGAVDWGSPYKYIIRCTPNQFQLQPHFCRQISTIREYAEIK